MGPTLFLHPNLANQGTETPRIADDGKYIEKFFRHPFSFVRGDRRLVFPRKSVLPGQIVFERVKSLPYLRQFRWKVRFHQSVDSPCDATQPHTDGVRRNEFPQS